VPLRAAYEHVPRLPQQGPDDPGPFSFADKDRVKRILTGAGFQPPRFTPVDLTFDVAGGKGIDAAVHQATTIGATSNALRDQPANLVAAATQAIRAALTPHLKDNRVLLQGAIWLVDAAT